MLVLVLMPIVAVLGLLVTLGVSRRGLRRFAADDDAFVCRVRASGHAPANWRRLRPRWSRHMMARWDGAVLIIRRGPVLDRTVRLTARAQSEVFLLLAHPPQPRGSRAIAVRLAVGSAVLVEVAAFEYAQMQLVGPYLTAAVNALPKAQVPRREI